VILNRVRWVPHRRSLAFAQRIPDCDHHLLQYDDHHRADCDHCLPDCWTRSARTVDDVLAGADVGVAVGVDAVASVLPDQQYHPVAVAWCVPPPYPPSLPAAVLVPHSPARLVLS